MESKPVPTRRNCPACDSVTFSGAAKKNGFELLSCHTCHTLYTATLPTSLNHQDYDDYYNADNLLVPAFIAKRLDEIVAGFARYRKTNRLLEIGFGAGSFLQAAARAGWQATGVEVSQPAVDHVRAMGFDVFHGELSEADYPEGDFDVIIASELFEHVADPRRLIEKSVKLLRPGGLLWATTPNGRGLSGKLLGPRWTTVSPPEHLHLFSKRGMLRLLRGAHFSSIRVDTEGLNPYEIVHAIRAGNRDEEARREPSFDRVGTSYHLNANLIKSPWRRSVKRVANYLLRTTTLGDSLKIWAIR
jgi:SAM-dependent methyltransferase